MKTTWQFPKTVKAFYVKLYLDRNRKTPMKLTLEEANKSWYCLKPQEKKMIAKKYNESYQQYETNYAEYLKTLTPTSKTTNVSVTDISDSQISDPNESSIDISPSRNITIEDIQVSTPTESTTTVTGHSDLKVDQDSEHPRPDHEADSELIQVHVKAPPQPPKFKSGRELYHMLKSTENTQEYATLAYCVKTRYETAATKIKNNYIKDYEAYLNGLTSRELHGHMLDILGENISRKYFKENLGVLD